MSSDGSMRKGSDDGEEADFSNDATSQNDPDEIKKERMRILNNIRCQRYRDKKKKAEAIVRSHFNNHRTVTVEEDKKRRRYSKRQKNKKIITNLINLYTNQSSKTVANSVSKGKNVDKSQIAGPSTINVPNVPPIQTTDLASQNEPCIPVSNSDNDDNIDDGTPSQDNYVPQLHEPIVTIYETKTQNILSRDVRKSTQVKKSSDGGKRKRKDNDEQANLAYYGKSQSEIDEIKKERKRILNNIRCQRYRDRKKKKTDADGSQNSDHQTMTVDEEKTVKKEYGKRKSQRQRDKKIATNVIKLHRNKSSATVANPVSKGQNFDESEIADPSAINFAEAPSIHTADTSTSIEPCKSELHSDNDDDIDNDTPTQINYVPQLHEPIVTIYEANTQNVLSRDVQNNTQMKTSSDDGNEKRQDDDEEVSFTDDGSSQNDIEEIRKKRKRVLNKIRCQRYRDKKKKEMDALVSSPTYKQPPITAEEEEKIKRRKAYDRQKSQRYRDKKRATKLINLYTNPSPKTVAKHVTPSQVSFVPQLHEPLITSFVPNTQNILPRDAQNNTRIMHSRHNVYVQTYSSFQQNSCAHREFQKEFFENDFGHACDICDRLWFKKDLNIFVNDDTIPNIQFIRSMLSNLNVIEVKICSTCLTMIGKDRVPPLAVYNGFKYPPFPKNLRKLPLDLVTERLVSPRIPFMQIRRLRHSHGQSGIYGQVINVPIELDTMVYSLPRNIDDDHSITVHIKKRTIHKSRYVNSIVNKSEIKAWLRYLKGTPLYTSYGITVDDNFLNEQEDVQEMKYDEDGDSEISEQIPIDESLIAQQQTLMWNDEMYLRIALGEGNDPINLLFDEHAEELSFPQIYLGQFRTFREGVSVTPFMMATSELRRSDRRGVTPQHLLYLAMKVMGIRIRDSLNIAFKHEKGTTAVTKEQIESGNYMQGYIESNLSFLRTIPNSVHYWSERKKDLFAMIRQYGKPTVSFSISANEVGWPKLLQLLHNLKNKSEISFEDVAALHIIEKSTLVNEDAVTCAIYFNKLVNVLMKTLQSKRFSPFKKYRVIHYFKRIDFPHRGSPHAHILAWLENAPEDALGMDYDKAIDLIDYLISVSAAEASGNIELQTHKHTFTCYEGIASKMHECRFEAPFMPIKTTMILTPMKDTEDGFKEYKTQYNSLKKKLENCEYDDFESFYGDNNINSDQEYVNIIRAGIKRPRVFPKRQPHEKWHNPFNPFILNILKSNTNFQFITEDYSCATYVMEYVNKTNRSVSNLQKKIIEIMDEHPELDLFEITKNYSINLLNHTEITTQEAAWYLLREPLSKSSSIIVYIPTVWPIERLRIKKTMKELSEMDEDCTDIWKEDWFDKYERRPEDLENISLMQFVSKYYKNKKGEYALKDEPRVIRYRNYDKDTEINDFKREMVTLHIPFRDEEAEILNEMKFNRIYDENVDLISQKRKEFESNLDIERILQICQELCHKDASDDNEVI